MDHVSTDAEIEDILNHHLEPTEIVRSILTVRSIAPGEGGGTSSELGQVVHVLAVISSSENIQEEGSVFNFKPVVKTDGPEADVVIDYQLLTTLPLTNALSISMAQSRSRSSTIDLRTGKYAPAAKPLFTLTLTYGRRKWSFSTESSEALSAFIGECRRLTNIANAASYVDFRWLSKYHSKRQLQVPVLLPRPDLRSLQKPPYSSLSPATAGQPGDEEADILVIIDNWLRTKFEEDQTIFTGGRNVRLRLGTFNVNGKTPSQDLSPWIRPQHSKTSDKPYLPPLKTISPISLSSFTASDYLSIRPVASDAERNDLECDSNGEPDIYVLGFQELDLSTEALLYSYNTIREDMWLEAIFASLGEMRNEYTKLISKQLVGMLIICIVKNELVKDITDVKTCAIGTGIMGVMGNKGAVAIRLTLHSTVMTFVNAHLAAFDEYTERRNADFHDLSRRLLFISQTETEPSENTIEQPTESIFQTDVLFWMVSTLSYDLNYRIDLPDTEVRQLMGGSLSTRKYDVRDLLSHDQLTKARLGGKAFENFMEGEVSNLPSYRFSAGFAIDANGYDTKRRPAWTDRILYQFAPHIRYRQSKYSVHSELTMSDHKPVSAQFCITSRQADESVYYEQVRNLVENVEDLVDSEETPKLKVFPSEIRFENVRYRRKVNQELKLQNTGKVPAAFRFVSQNENEPTFPPWLIARPQMGVILPNEDLSISLTTYVDETSAPALNVGDAQIQHTLILHTMRGKDHFVVVTGNYRRTCFANDLATLIRLPGPIRQSMSLREPPVDRPKTRLNAPREVMRLINWLMTNATDIHDLFLLHGDPELEESIRESLDTGEEFSFDLTSQPQDERRKSSLTFAGILFQFFQSLPSSVIPAALQERCAQAMDRDEAFEIISSGLPGYVLNVWISLTAFLHFIARRSSASQENPNDGSRATILASIFAPILLRDEPGSTTRITPLEKRRFLLHFIQ